MILIKWNEFKQKEILCPSKCLAGHYLHLLLYIFVVCFPLVFPATCLGGVFVSAQYVTSDLDTDYLLSKDKKADNPRLMDSISVGLKLNEWFSVEGFYADYYDHDEYKFGELAGLEKER